MMAVRHSSCVEGFPPKMTSDTDRLLSLLQHVNTAGRMRVRARPAGETRPLLRVPEPSAATSVFGVRQVFANLLPTLADA